MIDNRVGDNLQGLLDLLSHVKQDINPTRIIEVGSFIGSSTFQFAQMFPHATIFAVDMWQNDFDPNDPICQFDFKVAEKMFDTAVEKCHNVVKIKMNSKEFSEILAFSSMDFIYIDANHSYEGCMDDVMSYLPRVRQNGIIAGHDYIDDDYTEVTKVVKEVFEEPDKTFVDTSWMVKVN